MGAFNNDGGDLVRFTLGGGPVPEPGPGIGHLEKLPPPSDGALLSSAGKLIRRLAVRVGEREPRDFRWTTFDRVGLLLVVLAPQKTRVINWHWLHPLRVSVVHQR